MKILKGLSALAVVVALAAPAMAGGMGYGYGHGCGSGGKAVILLLALAAGYGVLVLSQYQQRPLNVIGRVVGGIILVVSFIGLICVAVCGVKCMVMGRSGMCAMPGMAKGAACHMPMKMMGTQTQTPDQPAQ